MIVSLFKQPIILIAQNVSVEEEPLLFYLAARASLHLLNATTAQTASTTPNGHAP
jgi:hypothetical protein